MVGSSVSAAGKRRVRCPPTDESSANSNRSSARRREPVAAEVDVDENLAEVDGNEYPAEVGGNPAAAGEGCDPAPPEVDGKSTLAEVGGDPASAEVSGNPVATEEADNPATAEEGDDAETRCRRGDGRPEFARTAEAGFVERSGSSSTASERRGRGLGLEPACGRSLTGGDGAASRSSTGGNGEAPRNREGVSDRKGSPRKDDARGDSSEAGDGPGPGLDEDSLSLPGRAIGAGPPASVATSAGVAE